ncbi:hypothetical protein [Alloactinosynnema sp. L-07]|uniref:hypothetical protein n=1 Tax=Alloactinosynnema sp. L-07 TaxID=1653480 RepID=UPI00065EFB02|nr:hypothetical protein [Alloactinosynnema sp. L-07]CRK57481.1 hypothetical protein [Alloactinosynnema sp. L-07]
MPALSTSAPWRSRSAASRLARHPLHGLDDRGRLHGFAGESPCGLLSSAEQAAVARDGLGRSVQIGHLAVDEAQGEAQVLPGGAVVEGEPAGPADDMDAELAQRQLLPIDALVAVLAEEQVVRAFVDEAAQHQPVGGVQVLALVDDSRCRTCRPWLLVVGDPVMFGGGVEFRPSQNTATAGTLGSAHDRPKSGRT